MRLSPNGLLWSSAALSILSHSANAQNSSQIVLEALESIVDCASCLAAFTPLQAVAQTGNDAFSDALAFVCDAAQVRCVFLTGAFLNLTTI